MKRAWILLLLAGCVLESTKYKSYPANPFPEIRVVAVLPFLNQTSEPQIDTDDFANVFASEMLKYDGFRVIRPLMVRAAMEPKETIHSVEDALRLARRLKADAVIAVALTDYEPYTPPKVGISVQFLRTSARSLSDTEIDRIVQSASWRRGPLEMPRDKVGNFIAAFERIYDSHQESVRSEVIAYAQAQEAADTPFVGEEEFLAVQSRYMQFVACQVLHQIIKAAGPDVR